MTGAPSNLDCLRAAQPTGFGISLDAGHLLPDRCQRPRGYLAGRVF
jgi:hypothetical protein